MENQDDLAIIMTSEQGKSLAESRGKIAYAASFNEWLAEEAKRVYGDTIPPHQANRRIVVMKEPIGVCTQIEFWCRMAYMKNSPGVLWRLSRINLKLVADLNRMFPKAH